MGKEKGEGVRKERKVKKDRRRGFTVRQNRVMYRGGENSGMKEITVLILTEHAGTKFELGI